MKQITVNAPGEHYAVICSRGAIARAGAVVSGLGDHTGVYALSSPRVWKLWGRPLEHSFREFGGCRKILFDDGETAKNLRNVEKVCRALVRAGADRGAVLVALGGGVVGDVAGFVAASFLRGVPVVQVPTTLVAQIDSAIGGKTGVNLPEGKNLVGAFHQPRLVLADPEVLGTLPARQYRSGLYEVIKYAVIGDEELFRFLERRLENLLQREAAAVDWVLPRCIAAKAEVVSHDIREKGLRRILNFGHTMGHALEAATGYRRFLHGEAVGWGMIAAARLGVLRALPESDARRIEALVRRLGPLPALPKIPPARLAALLGADKKTRGGTLHFVLPRKIGHVEVVADITLEMVQGVLGDARGRAARPARPALPSEGSGR